MYCSVLRNLTDEEVHSIERAKCLAAIAIKRHNEEKPPRPWLAQSLLIADTFQSSVQPTLIFLGGQMASEDNRNAASGLR
jgi:hypothetical protein